MAAPHLRLVPEPDDAPPRRPIDWLQLAGGAIMVGGGVLGAAYFMGLVSDAAIVMAAFIFVAGLVLGLAWDEHGKSWRFAIIAVLALALAAFGFLAWWDPARDGTGPLFKLGFLALILWLTHRVGSAPKIVDPSQYDQRILHEHVQRRRIF